MKIETSVAVQLGRLGFHAQEIERLVSISRSLHRIAERQCNEDTSCKPCKGTGADLDGTATGCLKCGGTADTLGRREVRLLDEARAIAATEDRDLKVYHQGDPRGCALYVYDPARLRELSKLWGHEAKIDECYSSAAVPIY